MPVWVMNMKQQTPGPIDDLYLTNSQFWFAVDNKQNK